MAKKGGSDPPQNPSIGFFGFIADLGDDSACSPSVKSRNRAEKKYCGRSIKFIDFDPLPPRNGKKTRVKPLVEFPKIEKHGGGQGLAKNMYQSQRKPRFWGVPPPKNGQKWPKNGQNTRKGLVEPFSINGLFRTPKSILNYIGSRQNPEKSRK